jgi:hypothetical protein
MNTLFTYQLSRKKIPYLVNSVGWHILHLPQLAIDGGFNMRKYQRHAIGTCLGIASLIFFSPAASAQSGVNASWTFDEASGPTVVDASDNGNTGNIISGTRIPGIHGSALSLNGTTDFVSINNSATLSSFTQLTIECWVNMRQVNPVSGGGQTIIRKENSYVIGIGAGGKVGFFINNGSGWQGSWTFSQQAIAPSSWNHIAGVWNGRALSVYINGVSDGNTRSVNGPMTISTRNVYIGKFIESAYEGFNGAIDELRLYGVALSADSIRAHFRMVYPAPVLIPYTPNPTYNQQPQLCWYRDKSISVYRLQIATNKLFSSPLVSVPLTDTSYAPSVNLPIGTVYWRVGNDADPSIWSAISSITILDSNVPLVIPYVPDPTRNRKPSLLWHSVKGSSVYTIQIDSTVVFSLPVVTDAAADTAYTPTVNLPIGTIYWRVKSNLSSQYSLPDTFRILNDSVPMLIPMAPDTQENRKPKFLWHPAAGAASYRIEIDTIGNFISPFVSVPILDTTYTPLVDLPYGRIVWRVSANATGNRHSDPDTFWVINKTGANSGLSRTKSAAPLGSFTTLRDGVLVAYSLDRSSVVSLEIFSMAGNRIATLSPGSASPGTHVVAWHGTDRWNKPSPSGSYLAVLRVNGRTLTKRIMLMR